MSAPRGSKKINNTNREEHTNQEASAPASTDPHIAWAALFVKSACFIVLGAAYSFMFAEFHEWVIANIVYILVIGVVAFIATFVLEVAALAAASKVLPSDGLRVISGALQSYFRDLGYLAGFFASFIAYMADHMVIVRDAAKNVFGAYWDIITSFFSFEVGFVYYAKKYYSHAYLVYVGSCLCIFAAEMLFVVFFPQWSPNWMQTWAGMAAGVIISLSVYGVFVVIGRNLNRAELQKYFDTMHINWGENAFEKIFILVVVFVVTLLVTIGLVIRSGGSIK